MKDKSARRAGDNFIDASTSNLFLDREGDENAYEPKYLRKIADYYKSMGLISERKLPMPRKLYGGIEAAIGGAALQGAADGPRAREHRGRDHHGAPPRAGARAAPQHRRGGDA